MRRRALLSGLLVGGLAVLSRALGVRPVFDIPLAPDDPEEEDEEPAPSPQPQPQPQPHATEPPPSVPAPSEPDDDEEEQPPTEPA